MEPRCPDCGQRARLAAEHLMGCLTRAVMEGLITPRQRQIRRLGHSQATASERLHRAIDSAGMDGGQIKRIVVGQGAWREIATSLPNGALLSNRIGEYVATDHPAAVATYMGHPVIIDAAEHPDCVRVERRDPYAFESAKYRWSFTVAPSAIAVTEITGIT